MVPRRLWQLHGSVRARERLSGREDEQIFFLGDLFATTEETVYFDWCHLGPSGNRIVAEGVYQRTRAAF